MEKYFKALTKHGIKLEKHDFNERPTWGELYKFGTKLLNINIEEDEPNCIIENNIDKGTIYEFKHKSDIKSTYGISPFNDGVRYIKVHPKNLGLWEAPELGMGFDKSIKNAYTIHDINRCGINGTFFGYENNRKRPDGDGKSPIWVHNAILGVQGKVLSSNASHAPAWFPQDKWYPQGVFVYYTDETFEIIKVKTIHEITKPYYFAIGGIELYPNYEPDKEGFKGIYSDVLRNTIHTSMGLTSDGMIIFARSYYFTRHETIQQLKDLGCILILGLDSGGSNQFRHPNDNGLYLERPSNPKNMRPVTSMLIATDLK